MSYHFLKVFACVKRLFVQVCWTFFSQWYSWSLFRWIKGLNLLVIAQISMDVPTTNLKFFESFKMYHSQFELPKLISIGRCGPHILHGAFKSGTEATSWELKRTLKNAFNLLHGSPVLMSSHCNLMVWKCPCGWKIVNMAIYNESQKILESITPGKQPVCKSFEQLVKGV